MEIPKKLAFYYGWPISAGDGTYDGAVKAFADYNMVVIASSLAFPSHGNHELTKRILNDSRLNHVDFYGYVNTSDNYQDLIDHIQAWKGMGENLIGIFCDRFGFDYPLYNLEDFEQKYRSGQTVKINRAHQNFLVREIHLQGFKAFVNAWVQEDVFGDEPSTGRKHNLNPDDWTLLESYQINTGEYVPEKTWRKKMEIVNKYRGQANFAATTTTANNYDNPDGQPEEFDQKKFNYAYVSSIVDNLQAFSYAKDMFSARIPLIPFHERPTQINPNTGGSIDNVVFSQDNGVYRLGGSSFVGASVNTRTHEVSLTL